MYWAYLWIIICRLHAIIGMLACGVAFLHLTEVSLFFQKTEVLEGRPCVIGNYLTWNISLEFIAHN